MHKGYTLNYFINFFSSIPDHRWTTDTLQKEGTVQKCAMGHCLTDQRTGEINHETTTARADALRGFIRNVEQINDGVNGNKKFGKTPRGRILKALRTRKRNGSL